MIDALRCAKCGAPLVGGSQFCSSCGEPCRAHKPTAPAARQTIHALAARVSTACLHCAAPVPVNGPVQNLHCNDCEKDMPMPPGLANALVEADKGTKILAGLGGAFQVVPFSNPNPECPQCGNSISFEDHRDVIGKTTILSCPGCGANIPTYPAPEWFKQQLPTALQVFGGDADIAKAAGIDLQVNEAKPAPIAMACPKCGGGLTITSDTARTVECTYCKASVFLPDALWKRLHPVKTMLRWTLVESLAHQGASAATCEPTGITFVMKVSHNGSTREQHISRDEVKIGSAPHCTLQINDDAEVSRIHAAIENGPNGVWLIDLGSALGTYLNGNKITKASLHSGDTITVGDTIIHVTFTGAGQNAPPASHHRAEPVAPAAPETPSQDADSSGRRDAFPIYRKPSAPGRFWTAMKGKLAFPAFMLAGISVFMAIVMGPSVAPPFFTNWHVEGVVRRVLGKASASSSDAELLEHINHDLEAEGVTRYWCDGAERSRTQDLQLPPAMVTFTRVGNQINADVKYTQEVHSWQGGCTAFNFHFRESGP